jgi:prevent-host-death family protein
MVTREQPAQSVISVVPATEARNHFGEMLKRVHNGKEQLVVEKDGLPIAVLLSHPEFEEYRRLKAVALLEQLNRAVNRDLVAQGYTEGQALEDMRAIKKEVYEETYGKRKPSRRKPSARHA